MKIAVLSDSHDHIWNLKKVLENIRGKVEMIVHCGDVIAPFTANLLGSVGLPTYVCLGNNDEDHLLMKEQAGENVIWVPIGREYGEIEVSGRKIAFTHYPKLAELLAKQEDYDAIFYGHTHIVDKRYFGKTLLLNPGAVCGIQSGKPGKASYAIYDTEKNDAEVKYL